MRKLILAVAILATVSVYAEQKNVQLLTNLSDAQLGLAMSNMSASLGVHCDFCHVFNEQTKSSTSPTTRSRRRRPGAR